MTNLIQLAETQKQRAFEVIETSGVVRAWENIGAQIHLVGSLKIGVLAKHRDIDFHIYTADLDVGQSFDVMTAICCHPQIKRCEFNNLAETEECCFEWHAWFEDCLNKLWQIDMIQMKQGSKYDGYFEKIADEIKAQMTDEMRQTILKLKFETPDELKIGGIEYYKAVIQNNITELDQFLEWRKRQKFDGIIEW